MGTPISNLTTSTIITAKAKLGTPIQVVTPVKLAKQVQVAAKGNLATKLNRYLAT